jgi:hypothetical protein
MSTRPAMAAPDAPYDRLAALPRALWLPAVITSAGRAATRLADLRTWCDALLTGDLPRADADFGDSPALQPLRRAVGELGLPRLCKAAPAMAEQVLAHTVVAPGPHHRPAASLQPRAEAIAQVNAEFREAWLQEKGD